jgi:hypothetical protein
VYGEVTTENYICRLKLKARVVATARKFPGFHTFSGYPHIYSLSPAILVTMDQMRRIIGEIFDKYPMRYENFYDKIQDLPKSSH